MNKLYPKKNPVGSIAIQMSGSGSSCFSLFEDKVSAINYETKVNRKIFKTKPVKQIILNFINLLILKCLPG